MSLDRKMEDKESSRLFKLLKLIPGYSGYARREARREMDKKLRDEIARVLDGRRRKLDELVREASAAGMIRILNDIGRLQKRLERTADLIRHASYGESPFLALEKIGEEELEMLYGYDLDLKERADRLAEQLDALSAAVEEDLRQAIAAIIEGLGEFDSLIAERRRYITEEF